MEKHILIVENDSNDIELLQEIMEISSVRCSVAVERDGVAALSYLRKLQTANQTGNLADHKYTNIPLPNLILLDLKMPRMDGFDVLKAAKSDPRLALIPIVIFTSSAEEQDIQRCYQLGSNAYVTKPASFNEYSNVIARMFQFWLQTNHSPRVT